MGLRLKFNVILIAACALGIASASALSYSVVQNAAVDEVKQQIRLLRANAISVRSYTLDSIEPLLSDDNDILFLPPTVTSYAARRVFSKFQENFPAYQYKEAALNPTNPADAASEFEASLIEQFRADGDLDQIATVLERDGERFLTMAFPLTVSKQGCLRCHSTPEAAPPAMVDLYGPENGFGWQLGETVGAQIISAPMSLAHDRARETSLVLVLALTIAFLLVLVVTNILLSRIVLKPVARMSDTAEKVSMGDLSIPEYTKPGTDEISSLSVSFNRMRRSVESAMRMIDE
ncbi:MAG: DUF3365 domain-containing protein [Pseudomonadota bacterium]